MRDKPLSIIRFMALTLAHSVVLAACASSSAPAASSAPSAPAALPAPARDPRAAPGADTLKQYRAWIGWARLKHPYPESAERMYAVMMCESGGRPLIVNSAGPYTGLFQYSNGTWNGAWNTYGKRSVRDPEAQILATALAWSLRMQSHWGCFNKTAGTP